VPPISMPMRAFVELIRQHVLSPVS
jgi:hypothetical protein